MSRSFLRLVLLSIGLLPSLSFSTEQSVELFYRYHGYASNTGSIDQTLLYDQKLKDWLGVELGGRLTEAAWNLRSGELKAELTARFLSFFHASVRASHAAYFPEGIGSTSLMGRIGAEVYPFRFIGAFASFGWYERFTLLSGLTFLPNLSSDSVRDHDFVGEFGLGSHLFQEWFFSGKMSTFEEMNVFNLNNPYFQGSLSYQPEGESYQISAFARYRLLLGFGRLNEFMVGVSAKCNLER